MIGYHKPQFSLIGDTVNTTSRVCSTGDEGSVTISDEAWRKLKGSDLIFKKKVVSVRQRIYFYSIIFFFFEAKGKGDLTTYQVSQKNGSESKFKGKLERALNGKII